MWDRQSGGILNKGLIGGHVGWVERVRDIKNKQESMSDRTGLQSYQRLADRQKRQGDWQAGQAGRIYLTIAWWAGMQRQAGLASGSVAYQNL